MGITWLRRGSRAWWSPDRRRSFRGGRFMIELGPQTQIGRAQPHRPDQGHCRKAQHGGGPGQGKGIEPERVVARDDVQELLGHANIATTRIYDHRRARPEDSPTLTSQIEAGASSGFNDADVRVVLDNYEAAEVLARVDGVLGLNRTSAIVRVQEPIGDPRSFQREARSRGQPSALAAIVPVK